VSGHGSIERRLPAILADLGTGPSPDYTDSLLARTAASRQRPGWAFLERWIPMSTAYSSRVATPRIPWRVVGAVALLILAMVVGALVMAGNQPRPLPAPPFGLAANGLLAYAEDGDIFTVDRFGQARAIVTGPDTDTNPVWSRGGTHLVFERRVTGEPGGRLYVARSDGSGLIPITHDLLSGIKSVLFSPDGREVIFTSGHESQSTISIANADGSGVRTLDVGIAASQPAFRPPGGKQIAFTGSPSRDARITGIYVVNADGSDLQMLVEPARDAAAGLPLWSPDGSVIAYNLVDFNVAEWTVHTRVMSADGSGDRALPMPADARFNFNAVWSNDGTKLAMLRGYAIAGHDDNVASVVPADGSGSGVETVRGLFAGQDLQFEWAPDDTSVLVVPVPLDGEPAQPQFLDPVSGDTRSAPDLAGSPPAWQRLPLPSQ
jgi:Tol biopolymer transport system component